MKKALLILLFTISPAFADDQNVYDFFRQLPNSDSAMVDEQTTALIKRHMANLLYPVDMGSFARPETDAKFREQVIALQRQMGVPATGTLTLDEFGRMAEAARDIDDRSVGTGIIKKTVVKDGDLASAMGTGGTDDSANPLAPPINISRIRCQRISGTCELSIAAFNPEDAHLYFYIPWHFNITTWEPARVTATNETPCATSSMTLDVQNQSVMISSVPHLDSSCANQGPTSWRLLDDGFSVSWKQHQDKVNKARALVYDANKNLVPSSIDASAK